MDAVGLSPQDRAWLMVCVTCDRFAAAAGAEASLGSRLAATLETALRRRPRGGELALRRVHCLSGCRHPGNVALGASGKCKLRLHGLGCGDLEDVLALAERYVRSPNGELAAIDWPGRLRERLASLVRPGAAAGPSPFAMQADD